MCGRYELKVDTQMLKERYHLVEASQAASVHSQAEVYPAERCPVIFPGPVLSTLKWGFKENFSPRLLINARGETILNKPTFHEAFLQQRCLIPVTAFFEWEKRTNQKIKHRITVKNLPIFSLAGIWKRDQQEEDYSASFVIITVEANPALQSIHQRMPAIILPEQEMLYLDQAKPITEIHKLLVPVRQELEIQ